jgi:allantoinase
VPCSQALNDTSAIIGGQVDAADFALMIIDRFDEMRQTAHHQPLVVSVILHSFISGQPFRLRALRRALGRIVKARAELRMTQPGAIACHFRSLQP